MKKFFLTSVIILICSLNLFGYSKTYILPEDSKKSHKKLEEFIKNSNKQIDIAVYNFEYKKIAKLLKESAKKGTQINILFEKSKLKNKKAKYDFLCKVDNINCKVLKDKKQHIKLMVFDEKTAMFGSANLTKESFNENLELIYFTDEKETIKKFKSFFKEYF